MASHLRVHHYKSWLFIILLPIFFLLHGYNENYALIPWLVVLTLLFKYLLITAGVILLSLLLLNNNSKAIVFAFFLLMIFFFFGAIHDFLKSWFKNSIVTSYKFFLPTILVVSVSVFFTLKYLNFSSKKLIRYIRLTLIAFLVIEVAMLLLNVIGGKSEENDLANKDDVWKAAANCSTVERPDIFFIVFDGYTSSQCLKEEFSYDNSELDSLLQENHFFVSNKSRSNYNVTPFSLASTFNGNYLRPEIETEIVSSRVFIQAMETFKNNHLLSFLVSEGYEIKNYGCFELKESPLKTKPYFEDAYSNQIDNQTLVSRIKRDIIWNFSLKNIFTGAFRVPSSYYESKNYFLYRNWYNWNQLLNDLKVQTEKPKFVYAHLMLPHEPFFLNAEGKQISDTAILLNTREPKVGYLEQVQFCNRLLNQLVPLATIKGERQKVVVIEGDHGYRFYDKNVMRDKEFMNLNAYYFSDLDYRQLYDGISPVNSFRVILNKYFCQTNTLLNDSSVYLINNLLVQ